MERREPAAIVAAMMVGICALAGTARAQEAEIATTIATDGATSTEVSGHVEEGAASLTVRLQDASSSSTEAPVDPPLPERPPEAFLLHGFRLGYMYTFDVEGALDSRNPTGPSYAQQYDVRSPHSFLFGYEVAWRMVGHEWLNVLLIGNVSIAGVEQSRFYPSGNLLFGFELVAPGIGDVQVGIGASFTPTKDEPVHMLLAAGIAPLIGSFYLPLHVFFVPDVDGHHRFGVTVGANFY
jgi:hypothetical protein